MDAQVEHEATATDEVQPVSEGEHRFFHAVGKGAGAGLAIGVVLGLAVSFIIKGLFTDIGGAQIAAIVVGSLAGGVFLGISVACGLHSDDILEH